MNMTVTIVHERFTEFAGSEQVVAQLARVWPAAPIVAPIAQPHRLPPELRDRVRGTALNKLLRPNGGYAHLLPALPVAMRQLRLGEPDLVLASHHAFSNQVALATDVPVISYVHSPARWVWDPAMRAGEAKGLGGAALLNAFALAYRPTDRKAASRLTAIIANSSAVATRIAEWWQQPSEIVHPPVDTDFYTPDETPREEFFLLAGRLVPYKQPDIAIKAAARAGVRLIVAGEGRMLAECQRIAGPHTEFVGRVSNDELRSLFRRCAGLLMPGVEDFGIVPVEAQACGAPVLATAAGGALDTVVPGVSGDLVGAGQDGLTERWTTALSNFDPQRFDHFKIRDHAEGFSRGDFRAHIRDVVERVTGIKPADEGPA